MKVGSLLSDIQSSVGGDNLDQFISPRLIFNKLLDYTYVYIRQKKNYANLLKDSSLVEYLDCENIIEANEDECCGARRVYKTANEIPSFNTTLGDGILYVTNIDDSVDIPRVYSFRDFKINEGRRFGNTQVMSLYANGHIYLSKRVKKINVGILKSPFKALEDLESNLGCKSIYDEDFPCPDDLIPYVKTDTVNYFLGTMGRVIKDESPDLDKSVKSKTNPVNI